MNRNEQLLMFMLLLLALPSVVALVYVLLTLLFALI